MGRGRQKGSPYQFSLVTSTNVEIRPQKFLTFSCSHFATLVKIVQAISSASPKSLNLNQQYTSKNWVFWSNPHKIEVMITSFLEMPELPNFGHMTTSTI